MCQPAPNLTEEVASGLGGATMQRNAWNLHMCRSASLSCRPWCMASPAPGITAHMPFRLHTSLQIARNAVQIADLNSVGSPLRLGCVTLITVRTRVHAGQLKYGHDASQVDSLGQMLTSRPQAS